MTCARTRHKRHDSEALLLSGQGSDDCPEPSSVSACNNHVGKIVALSEIYGPEQARRAIEDALEFQAFSCEYVADLLEQRQRLLPEPGALHLTRRQDLLKLELPEPNLGLNDTAEPPADQTSTDTPATDTQPPDESGGPHAPQP